MPSHLSNNQPNKLDTLESQNPPPENAARSHPTLKKSKKKNQVSQEVAEVSEQYHASGHPSDNQNGTQDPRNESEDQRHDGSFTTVRQRHKTSNTQISDPMTAQDDRSISDEKASGQPEERFLLSDMVEDGYRMTKTALRLPKVLYPIWKWFLLGYIIWMAITYLVASVYRFATTAMAPLCSIPFIAPQIPLCTVLSEPKDRSINALKVATSQEVLTVVMDQVGQNFGLARDMIGHEFAVRDLRIRVAASSLPRKHEFTRELESLIVSTKQTARDLSRFTARFGKSIDTIKTLDDYAVKALEDIPKRQRNQPNLAGQIISAFSPFAAFELAKNAGHKQEQVKHVFINTAARISDKVKLLIHDSFNLAHDLDIIQGTLDRIKELSIDEIGDLPSRDVLGALWTRLARANDYDRYKSHTSLLTELTGFYESSSNAVKVTMAALYRVEAELGEFRDDFAIPGLILKEFPFEVTIALLRNSGKRLEAGKRKLEHIEKGGRPQGNDFLKASTTTVSAT
ncbi:hypothetical protein EPUS_09337 [Endocarpon pusillum Z07020]|uniref:Uncharacterized protein n=1 Tax=Endocarpon pusillum (strain Z07020 / HMAS-L-300199) TaxID=1263415 RepID=U1GLS9_ENDPU|nr:uncharacterized protein EPUS_09337 [Endocarpon pusillum Z07020]ERF72861.1 hypothetical protein EPUS_09337 [Endocarpon pusillum Z07020]